MLPQMERDKLVAEWCRLVGKPISSQVETKRGRPESGINEASRQLGLERNDVHRAIKVASITPEAQQAAHEVGNRWASLIPCRAEVRVLQLGLAERHGPFFPARCTIPPPVAHRIKKGATLGATFLYEKNLYLYL